MKEPAVIEAIIDVKSHVQNMAVLYDRLYQSPNYNDIPVKEYLLSIIDKVISNFPNSTSVKCETEIDELILDAKRAQSIGIIFNELLTNIMKYAFTGRDNNLIKISASMRNNHIILTVYDNGKGLPESVDFENSNGLGLRLIGMLIKQLGGLIRVERGGGTRIEIDFRA